MCEHAQGILSPSVFRCMYLIGSLGPFHPFPFSERSLALSHCESLAHFFLVSADEDRSLATRREDEEWKMRGVEGEKKRLGAGGGDGGTGGTEREKNRRKEREGNRESREGR